MLPPSIRRAFRLPLARSRTQSADIDAEVAFHLQERIDALVARGWSAEDAAAEAARRFGDPHDEKRVLHDAAQRRDRRLDKLEQLESVLSPFLADLRFAIRSFAKNPVFTVTAAITLALGVGASTAIFSVVDAVLLRPLPYTDAGRLVYLESDVISRHLVDLPLAPGNYPDVQAHGTSFAGIGGALMTTGPLTEDGQQPEQVKLAMITPNLFRLLGIRIAFGRDFSPDDAQAASPAAEGARDAVPATLPVIAVLGHDFWTRRYGADSSVIGRTVHIGGAPVEIVGVLPPNVELLYPNASKIDPHAEVFAAWRVDYSAASRLTAMVAPIARLRPGATVAEAQREMDQAAAAIGETEPVLKASGFRIRVMPMETGVVADVRSELLALMGAVIVVLLIACANLSNLLIVRAGARHGEFTLRAALGATRWRLAQPLMAESIVLGVMGALLGLAVAQVGIQLLLAMGPIGLPRAEAVSINGAVLVFAISVAIGSAAIFGLLPALRASRPALSDGLRVGSRARGAHGAGRFRDSIVVFELALSFVLLIACGLMVRSVKAVIDTDPGYEPRGLVTFFLRPPDASPRARAAFIESVRSRLGGLPGVEAVTAVGGFPLDGRSGNVGWGTPDAVFDQSHFQQADVHAVLPGYFEVMEARVLAGRTFTTADNSADSRDVIIDDLLAKKAFPALQPQAVLGRRLLVRLHGDNAQDYNVIGVVRHEQNSPAAVDNREALYFADAQFGYTRTERWVLRTHRDNASLAPAIRAAVREIDPLRPVTEVQPAQAFIDRASAMTRFALMLIGAFAGIAAILASVGLYGVLASVVRQRTAEIGVRLAFGATSTNVFSLIIGRGMALSAFGIGAGFGISLLVTGAMRALIVGVTPNDPATYCVVALLFFAVALVACYVPARRAASLDPNVALRST